MKDSQKALAARDFAQRWAGRGSEKSDSQPFWISLLREVFGVERPEDYIRFEEEVKLDHTSFIDGHIDRTHVLVEQKSIDKDLRAPIRQSDGTLLSPFLQAKRYATELPYSQRPRWIVTCNFASFHVYDMERPQGEPEVIQLADLEREFYRLQFLVDEKSDSLIKEMQISIEAGELVGKLYDALSRQYKDATTPRAMRSLNVLCTRIVFCLYAEDADIFGHDMFRAYLKDIEPHAMRRAMVDLFHVLDTPADKRDPYLHDDNPALAAFPYVNGGLFGDEDIEVPPFSQEIKALLVGEACPFDWRDISPTIFGAVFESTLNPDTRRAGGMHYTSIENIHRVIDPLFLDDLAAELETIAEEVRSLKPENRTRRKRLWNFQQKLAALTFFDPACGSGNFLTETYLSLRRLENKALRLRSGDQRYIGGDEFDPICVSIRQFYGIEINDFAVTVAKTALWIAESQMMEETARIVGHDIDLLPLKTNANIVEGNALRTDWATVVAPEKLSYIMGNPPFAGARLMSKEQKSDVVDIFPGWRNAGNLDYVCCWYKKACDLMKGTTIRAALVSTNSVSQGEAVVNLWKPLMEGGMHIDFAYRTFRWDSESNSKAHVHCVIVGFSLALNNAPKRIFTDNRAIIANNINGYLVDGDDIFIESRTKPLCDVPEMGIGNMPIDDGNYLFTAEEAEEFVKKEPKAARYFKLWYGAYEFINQKPRRCLWLGDCSPAELRSMPECMKRVQAVKEFRLASKRAGTRKLADTPTRFHVENMPKEGDYIVIPKTSSEKRKYIPIGFMTPDVLTSDACHIIPSATLYHFGVLTSNVHMAWTRAVAGRQGMSYRYSNNIVYNNFPWPSPSEEQRARIEQTAQTILDARTLYPDSSLADLYDDLTMPPELRRAHQQNDRAVMTAYGFPVRDTTETSCIAALMRLYQKLTNP